MNLTRRYGDLVRYETAYGPTYLVNHPDDIAYVLQQKNYPRASLLRMVLGAGLLSSEGERWQHHRRLLQPSFNHQRISAFGSLITGATMAMLRRWPACAEGGQPLDIAAEMLHLTLKIIFQVLAGAEKKDGSDMLSGPLTTLLKDIGGLVRSEFAAPFSLSSSRNRRLRATLRTIDQLVYELIDERRRGGHPSDDLLSLLLLARDETGRGLDDLEVRDEVVTLVFAGSETTSLMLAWTWCLLFKHPEVERTLHEELARTLGGRPPGVEDLPHLKYTRMVLEESMRIYPPVWAIFRKAAEDDKIGGYHVPAKSSIVVSPYTMHRHPGFWESPEQFDPERFRAGSFEGRHRYAYLPFGGGRHLCLGNHFAMMEGQLILATIAQRYRLRLVPGHPVETQPGVTLRPRRGLMMTLEKRPMVTTGTHVPPGICA